MDPTLKLHKSSSVPLSDPTIYRKLVGRLLYLTHTRHDIYYVVGRLSQCLQSPTDIHMQAATHTFKYLKGNVGKCLFFSSSSSTSLTGFSDSNWGACPDTQRSINRFMLLLRYLPNILEE